MCVRDFTFLLQGYHVLQRSDIIKQADVYQQMSAVPIGGGGERIV
jgi:hypothetical protein